ncbi:hypothetical protein AKJ50_00600 [candidate division MSBL1 archaeon SCGC-AAA382A13]|uniref:Uncharacterized protein n=1 Tax=candidate division MSBL1 archaeon SCGC-AAA382A13 TaxID=1698279 RepID=A0A133VGJ9_9EURY|nr:hypothetical protein AKJ50_00600 [candidate division MSBL1 archaeon SCGC-AAA382A13]
MLETVLKQDWIKKREVNKLSIQLSIESLLPFVVPFLIGLICGLLVKVALKLAIGILALTVILSWGGYKKFWSIQELFDKAQEALPKLFGEGRGLLNSLPYTAPSFIVGLLIGIWWGK